MLKLFGEITALLLISFAPIKQKEPCSETKPFSFNPSSIFSKTYTICNATNRCVGAYIDSHNILTATPYEVKLLITYHNKADKIVASKLIAIAPNNSVTLSSGQKNANHIKAVIASLRDENGTIVYSINENYTPPKIGKMLVTSEPIDLDQLNNHISIRGISTSRIYNKREQEQLQKNGYALTYHYMITDAYRGDCGLKNVCTATCHH